MPATKATAATIQAMTKSAAPTIRQDFRWVRMPLTHAVVETTSAASERPTSEEDRTAAGRSSP